MNLFFPPLHRHHRIKLPPISTWHLSDWQWLQHPLIKCYFREYCTRTIIIVVGKRLKKTEVSLVPSVDSRSTRNGKLPLNKLPWKLNRRITPARHTVNARLSKHTHTLYPNIAGHWGEINFTNPRKTFANKTVYLISIPQQQQQCFLKSMTKEMRAREPSLAYQSQNFLLRVSTSPLPCTTTYWLRLRLATE